MQPGYLNKTLGFRHQLSRSPWPLSCSMFPPGRQPLSHGRRDVPTGSTCPTEWWQIALAIEELCQRKFLRLSLSWEDLQPHLNLKQQISFTDPKALFCLRTANIRGLWQLETSVFNPPPKANKLKQAFALALFSRVSRVFEHIFFEEAFYLDMHKRKIQLQLLIHCWRAYNHSSTLNTQQQTTNHLQRKLLLAEPLTSPLVGTLSPSTPSSAALTSVLIGKVFVEVQKWERPLSSLSEMQTIIKSIINVVAEKHPTNLRKEKYLGLLLLTSYYLFLTT